MGLVLSVVLIWKLIGWPSLLGVLTVIIAQAVNALITRVLLQKERLRRIATDSKLRKIIEFVEAIRHLRWYGWQDFWQDQIMEARQDELNLRITTSVWGLIISFTNNFASGMFPVAAFYAYTALAELPLTVDVAFPALQLFTMLESNLRDIPGLITVLLNAKVAMGRIEDFMNEPNKEEALSSMPGNTRLSLQDATFAWPGSSRPVLHGIELAFPTGLTLICGKVAAGKTALLQALMGELDSLGGHAIRPNELIGYCAQTPWLQSMSIRDNILFSSPYEKKYYREVLEACALLADMAEFKHGDLSNIGENGIGLSGGQKARVALARALYSRAKILLLDDPLSALDHQTAETIVRQCFGGSLLKGRTIILVTHRTELCLDFAEQIVEFSDGRARILEKEATLEKPSSQLISQHLSDEQSQERRDEEEALDEPEEFMEEEHRAHGGVKAYVYWEYIKAGKLKWWAVLIFVLALYRLIAVGETWFLKEWGESYTRPLVEVKSGILPSLPSPELDIRPWLVGFFVLAAAQASMFLISQGFMIVIIYTAGRRMFAQILDRVGHAVFRFYDVTPVGRLMNRMTSDIGTVDGNISQQFQAFAWLSITWVSSIVVIASITPLFLVFSLALTAAFVLIFLRFLPTSQSLRRLEVREGCDS